MLRHAEIVTGPKGFFALDVYRRGVLIERIRRPNLVVNGSKAVLASLTGGAVANQSITTIGFGTNATAPAVGNTTLTSPYTKPVDQVTYPVAGQVQFAFSLSTAEDNGVAISEFGLITAAGTLFSRLVRSSPLNKDTDIALSGTWLLQF